MGPGWPKPNNAFHEAALPALRVELPTVAGAEYVDDDSQCASCHAAYADRFKENVHHGIRPKGACEACHGPGSKHVDAEGKKPGLIISFKNLEPAQQSEICARCHEADACAAGSQWRTSIHAHRGLSCLACHTAHYERRPDKSTSQEKPATEKPGSPVAQFASHAAGDTQPAPLRATSNLGAVAPTVCYRCHADLADLQLLAGPHQIGGPNGFNCTTCHDPHGKLREASRTDLCLSCHQRNTPTMAWHSATHALAGVACTDCHNPHPRTNVPQAVDISHTSIRRPQRHAMSVQEPETCYKCHPQIFGLTNLPSHHPIQEGRMVCSDCHDAHGQAEGGLKEPTLNQLCYRCHSEKEGPFAYEHPPVTEDCAICHEPHGTLTNNLLRQPTSFLCLRCHSGHRSDHRPLDAAGNGPMREALYADCTQCHAQVHGSDLIPETLRGRGLSR